MRRPRKETNRYRLLDALRSDRRHTRYTDPESAEDDYFRFANRGR
jgi:hypothetical protein